MASFSGTGRLFQQLHVRYDAAMRRVLIGLTVTLLLVVSIGVGVVVARLAVLAPVALKLGIAAASLPRQCN